MKIQIVFVGHHDQRIIESIRKAGEMCEKIVLVKGQDPNIEGEDICWATTSKLESELSLFWSIEIIAVDKINVLNSIQQLLEYIKLAKGGGNDITINASGSMRTLAIAGYFAACITKCRFFTALPRYDLQGRDIGTDHIIDVPKLPFQLPGREQLEILSLIGNGIASLDELVSLGKSNLIKNTMEFRNERSRLSHHLAKMEEIGMIQRERKRKNIHIVLTPLGKALRTIIG